MSSKHFYNGSNQKERATGGQQVIETSRNKAKNSVEEYIDAQNANFGPLIRLDEEFLKFLVEAMKDKKSS